MMGDGHNAKLILFGCWSYSKAYEGRCMVYGFLTVPLVRLQTFIATRHTGSDRRFQVSENQSIQEYFTMLGKPRLCDDVGLSICRSLQLWSTDLRHFHDCKRSEVICHKPMKCNGYLNTNESSAVFRSAKLLAIKGSSSFSCRIPSGYRPPNLLPRFPQYPEVDSNNSECS